MQRWSCLDDEMIERFVAGALDSTARSHVEAELARCTRCAALVAAVARDDEELERYTLGATIARGGMGTIVAAFDRRLNRDVAIKCLDSHRERARLRFDREIEITGSLQHPNIVPIYDAGALPDGRPFYAMRHVLGRDLGAVIAAATTLEHKLALLAPIASAVDAVAYAHERGVVHRDLKPLNILVGPFGETVVIDWGLAKLGNEDSPDDDHTTDEHATRAGAILGTPRYMSPEQARGEPATTRSDVYALGAILYHALAGAAPSEGASASVTIELRARGEIVPLAQLAPATPRELLAIVERAMAHAPRDRYPTASALAADLRRFQTGQLVSAHRYTRPDRLRRFVQRYRLALVVAAVGACVAATIGVASVTRIVRERDNARTARALVEREHARTENLVQFMFSDLRSSLAQVGRFDIMRDVADRIDAHLDDARAGEPETQRARAAVLSIRAGVADGTGQPGLATQLAGAAQVLLDTSERREPSRLARQIRAGLYTQAGVRAAMSGDHTTALAQHRLAAATWRSVLGVGDIAMLALATSLGSVGEAADRTGDAASAYTAWAEASVLVASALATSPDAALKRLALVRFAIGQSRMRHGEHELAERELAAARTALATISTSNNELRGVEVMVLNQLADARLALGRGEITALHLRVHELATAGVTAEPSNMTWRRQLARSWRELARDASIAGDLARAATQLELSVIEFDRISTLNPSDQVALRGSAIAASELAQVLVEREDTAGARRAIGRAVKAFAALAKPGDATSQLDLAFMLGRATRFERMANNLRAARKYVARAIAVIDRFPPDPDRPLHGFYHAVVLGEAAALSPRVRAYRARMNAIVAELERRKQMLPAWREDLEVPR